MRMKFKRNEYATPDRAINSSITSVNCGVSPTAVKKTHRSQRAANLLITLAGHSEES